MRPPPGPRDYEVGAGEGERQKPHRPGAHPHRRVGAVQGVGEGVPGGDCSLRLLGRMLCIPPVPFLEPPPPLSGLGPSGRAFFASMPQCQVGRM